MIVFEAERVRRLVARLERGEHVLRELERLAEQHEVNAGWIRALGAFEWVELCEYDQQAQRYRSSRRFDTPCEILTLEGNLSLKEGRPFPHVHATVSRETDTGVEVLGGHLNDGVVFVCEVSVEIYDDLALHRAHDPSTGLALWARPDEEREASAGGPHPAQEADRPSWGEVAQASGQARQGVAAPSAGSSGGAGGRSGRGRASRAPQTAKTPPVQPEPLPQKRKTTEDEFFQKTLPGKGDWVEHRHFGLCRVQGEDPEGGAIIKLPSGVRKTINLDYLEVGEPRDEGDRRVFPLYPRRKR